MEQRLSKAGVKYLLLPFRWTLLMAAAFFLAAGRMEIPRAWFAFGLHLAGAVAGGALMWRCAPGLANQRAAAGAGTRTWDKAILAIYFLLVLLGTPIVAGLDVGRYRWSLLGGGFAAAGTLLYILFFGLFHWAMLTNAHFEGTARIQHDRHHRVVTTGPYALVRHPGYVAMIFASLSDALIIGSRWALIPGAAAVAATIVRTAFEDRMLRRELQGYTAYAEKVPYRLIPGIW